MLRIASLQVLPLMLFAGSSEAFVQPTPIMALSRSLASTRSGATTLQMLEPASMHLFESASFVLSDTMSAPPEAGGIGYSKASYYTILGLFAISFPGLWSTIKRSTKTKIKRKTYVSPGEKVKDGLGLRQQAGEIMACKSFILSLL
jgi:Cofactor assembly of complex C subunit B